MSEEPEPLGSAFIIPEFRSNAAAISRNPYGQLLVPPGQAKLVRETGDTTWVVTASGKWLAVADEEGGLAGSRFALYAPAPRDKTQTPRWIGNLDATVPATVLDSLAGRFQFLEGALDGSRPGLRTPQIGAVHSVLGYWATSPTQPSTVVMPTGTGKTDTMIALFAAARPECLLVLVPTDALRGQLARKFENYGVLLAA